MSKIVPRFWGSVLAALTLLASPSVHSAVLSGVLSKDLQMAIALTDAHHPSCAFDERLALVVKPDLSQYMQNVVGCWKLDTPSQVVTITWTLPGRDQPFVMGIDTSDLKRPPFVLRV